jgi:hypothetical protein
MLLRSFYLFTGLRWFRLTGALWMLYLLSAGWPLWQVGAAEGAYHVVGFLSAVPTGSYADALGRRRAVVIGLAIGGVSLLGTYYWAPQTFWGGLAAMALGALGWNFVSGADHALLADLAAGDPDPERAYRRALGRADALGLLSGAAAAALGGLMATAWGWVWPYVLGAASLFIAIPVVLTLPEPRREARPHGEVAASVWATMESGVRLVRAVPALFGFVVFGGVLGVVTTMNHLYAQTTLVTKGDAVAVATAVIAVNNLLAAASSAMAQRLPQGTRSILALRIGALLVSVLVGTMGGAVGLIATALFLLSGIADGGLEVLYIAELTAWSPPALRATVLSIPDSLFSLGMIVCFPLSAWTMGRFGLAPTYAGWGVMLALLTFWTWRQSGRSRGSQADLLGARATKSAWEPGN